MKYKIGDCILFNWTGQMSDRYIYYIGTIKHIFDDHEGLYIVDRLNDLPGHSFQITENIIVKKLNKISLNKRQALARLLND
jgi:hypothetical protein